MKQKLLFLILALSLSTANAQQPGNLNFINDLAEKGAATFGDAVTFFILIDNKKPGGFNRNLAILNKSKIATGITEGEASVLTRGTLSLMIARRLDLKDSLFYAMTGASRYAFRACVAADIMDINASEWDTLSGEELIEIMAIVSEKLEAAQ